MHGNILIIPFYFIVFFPHIMHSGLLHRQIGSALHQQIGHHYMPTARRICQGTNAITVGGVDICALLQQVSHDFEVAFLARVNNCCVTLRISIIKKARVSVLTQPPDLLNIVGTCRLYQRLSRCCLSFSSCPREAQPPIFLQPTPPFFFSQMVV